MKIKSLLFAVVATVALFANGANIIFLDTYDQLSNYVGTDSLIFVRDAASSRTGQHGDPRLHYGSAWYVFDPRLQKFQMAGSQESNESASSINPSNYISKAAYAADANATRRKITSFEQTVASNTTVVVGLQQSIADIHTAVDVDTIVRIKEENEQFRRALIDITNIVIHVDSDFKELKAATVEILKSADKALGGEGVYNLVPNP